MAQFESKRSILVVDDNRGLLELLYYGLKSLYDVRQADTAIEAMKMLQTYTPDLVITDMMMPEMNGMEFVQRLRARPETEDVPVIMLTAKTGNEAHVGSLDAGADIYMPKPFNMDVLKAQVRTLLKKR